MARTIAGQLTLPDDTPLAGAEIHFTAKRNEATKIITGISSYFMTNGSGNYSEEIENGYYSVSISYSPIPSAEPRRWILGSVWVSNGAPVTLNALLSVNGSTADPTDAALLQLLADAQQARDIAVAAAEESEDAAANLLAQKGEPNGIMPLDANGLAPAIHLPSYVDDVLEFDTYASLPAVGETGKIYVVTTAGTQGGVPFPANQQFRWTGTQYVKLVASPGTTDNVPEGAGNLYFTQARVRSTTLAGLSETVSTKPVAADSILVAFGKVVAKVWSLAIADISGLQAALNAKENTANKTSSLASPDNVKFPTSQAVATGLAEKVNNDDARLTNSREWTATTVAQAEAEAGTATTRRAWTAQRVRQAIVAWWSGYSTATGRALATAATPDAALTELGFGATGKELATAPTADAARSTLELDSAALRAAIGEGDVYARGGIVGTVSQSGGMPSGSLIEEGSGPNGTYVKFADGTMWCMRYFSVEGTANQVTTTIWVYPSEFVGGAADWHLITYASTQPPIHVPATYNLDTPDQVNVHVSRSINGIIFYSVVAIGRWF